MATPSKKTLPSRSPTSEILKVSENFDPNVPISAPLSSKKPMKSPAILSAQSNKANPKTSGRIVVPPPPPERARKFIVAKKSSGRAGKGLDFEKCRKEAYEALRASQEEFFRRGCSSGAAGVADSAPGEADRSKDGSEEEGTNETGEIVNSGAQEMEGVSEVTKMRTLAMEKAMSSMPEPGSGRVKHLVKAFESLLSIPKDDEGEKSDEERKLSNWTLPGLQQSAKLVEAGPSSTSFFSSAEFFPSGELERDLRLYSSIQCHSDRLVMLKL
ncbi:hypothetical protein B296_00015595 [Ensete ventricosum]|uniref:Calmodulin-binding domain-containing protein n=1 Tax=Ensete ventricosum TaxID=4639 RepID=A0A427B197_ENSVE|nr:hypothetical protein B296_00015595 [Ensete ventricosum]